MSVFVGLLRGIESGFIFTTRSNMKIITKMKEECKFPQTSVLQSYCCCCFMAKDKLRCKSAGRIEVGGIK